MAIRKIRHGRTGVGSAWGVRKRAAPPQGSAGLRRPGKRSQRPRWQGTGGTRSSAEKEGCLARRRGGGMTARASVDSAPARPLPVAVGRPQRRARSYRRRTGTAPPKKKPPIVGGL